MYVESIKFKRTKDSKWERGYYIGDTDNSMDSTLLDSKYQPLLRNEKGHLNIWDYTTDLDNWIQFRCEEKDI